MSLLQVLLFDNLNLSIYITPLAYIAFFVLLPINTPRLLFLILGLVMGVTMDMMMGTSGLNTIASLATGYLRPWMAAAMFGKDAEREGETPLPRTHGRGKWLRYTALLTGLHCLLFFMFEAMSLHNLIFTLTRAVCSGAVTFAAIWFIGSIYPVRK